MRVTELHLTDFRNYADQQVAFGPGVTTLVGRNGQGKTNLVEAVRYISALQSHRVSTTPPLIRAGTESAVIQANVTKAGRSLSLELTVHSSQPNTARLGRTAVKPRDLLSILRTVVFSPEDLALVKGEPSGRRAFMDELCVALAPIRAGDLTDYERVLRQRVSMLKSARHGTPDLSLLDIWDEKLADLGGRIIHARRTMLGLLHDHVTQAYRDVAPDGGACSISYAGTVDVDDAVVDDGNRVVPSAEDVSARMLELLRERRAAEIERGVTLTGPHRDDLNIVVGQLSARGYASHGESWSCALALRLGSYDLLTADDGPDAGDDAEPVLILDDVFAELDSTRRSALAARVAQAAQVIITAAVPDDVPEDLRTQVMTVVQGTVSTDD